MASPSTMDRLVAGYRAFRAHYYEHRPELFEAQKTGQSPEVMFIACSDSRVDPAILTQSAPGELFVVRNVANIVPPYRPDKSHHGTSTAIEFAVRDLNIKHIIVLGHSQCGGIQALMREADNGPSDRDFMGPWMSIVGSASSHRGDLEKGNSDIEALREVEQAAICISISNLATYPWLREALNRGDVRSHGWWFDLQKGRLWALNPNSRKFGPRT